MTGLAYHCELDTAAANPTTKQDPLILHRQAQQDSLNKAAIKGPYGRSLIVVVQWCSQPED